MKYFNYQHRNLDRPLHGMKEIKRKREIKEIRDCVKWLKKKKKEARRAELAAADSDDDCSASSPKCRRPTGKQVRVFDSRL